MSRAGRPIDLGPTEYRLLEFLMERAGRVSRTVDVHIGRLRKAIKRGREPDPVRTVRGAGYSLDDRFGRSE